MTFTFHFQLWRNKNKLILWLSVAPPFRLMFNAQKLSARLSYHL
jgi:hypothetical protein